MPFGSFYRVIMAPDLNSCWKIRKSFYELPLSYANERHRILRDNEPPPKSDFSVAIKELTGRGKTALSICNPIILLVSRNEASLGKCFLSLKLRNTGFSGVDGPKRQFLDLCTEFSK